MRLTHIAAMLLAATSVPAMAHGAHGAATGTAMPQAAATPVDQLAVPPADAQPYLLLSTAGQHGTAFWWCDANGDSLFRESMNLRGQVFEQDTRIVSDADGRVTSMTIRGVTPNGNAAETYSFAGGVARWSSPVDGGEAASDGTRL